MLENCKSFRHAELYIDCLTVLIGTNASGKSNLVEVFEFLKRIASGETIDIALNGEKKSPSIRGGQNQSSIKILHNLNLK
ncbi:MAG: AAA family ATPase [Synechocystis sp.]